MKKGMKRMVLGLALASGWTSAATAQQVSTELYGDFRYSYNRADAGEGTHWASANNASRLGVRAQAAGERLTAFTDLQVGVNVDAESAPGAFTQRYYLAGVRGALGTLTVGRHSTAYKAAGQRLDPFYDTSTLSVAGGVPTTGLFAGASFGLSPLTNGWTDRAVAYTSPSLRGFTANAATYIETDSDFDYGLGLGYRGFGFDGGVQYYDVGSGRTWAQSVGVDHALRGAASFGREWWSLGASYERLEAVAGGSQDYVFTVGTVNVIPSLMLAGAVGHVGDSRAIQPVTGTAFHAGVFYALLPQARVNAIYSHLDTDAAPNRGNVALGFTYQFSLKGQ